MTEQIETITMSHKELRRLEIIQELSKKQISQNDNTLAEKYHHNNGHLCDNYKCPL